MYFRPFLVFILCSFAVQAQQETEIYFFEFYKVQDTTPIVTFNFKNISQNKGYDSQPSFISNFEIIYAGTHNSQTEILYHDTSREITEQINAPTLGGEYSPQWIPNSKEIAAVRLDPNGLQRLYSYNVTEDGSGSSKELLADYKVAYFTFYDNNNIVASVIEDDQLNLIKANLSTGVVASITTNTGRSIHKVPESKNVSYTAVNEDGIHEVYIIDILGDNQSYYVCDLPVGIQDHCWLNATELLLGSGSKLYKYDLFGNGKWEEVADLSDANISEINRITVSPDKSKIALVGSPIKPLLTPGVIVDAHIAPFNERNLRAFSEAFSEDVIVKRFPADTTQVGRQALYDSYQSFFKNKENFNVSVTNRMIHNDWVIDEEKVIVDDKTHHQATLYNTQGGYISEMTFLERKRNNNPELLVDKQLEGYNARDIDAFMEPFDEQVVFMDYPSTVLFKGKDALRDSFKSFFDETPNLNVTLKNRIVNGNKVIDQEVVVMNTSIIHAVAIYEVENNKIIKVTFLPN